MAIEIRLNSPESRLLSTRPNLLCDTHLEAYLGVHGPIEDLSVADPDDGGCWLGVISMAGQIERVAGSQAHHWPSADDGVFGWYYGSRH